MDWRSSSPIEFVVTVRTIDKNWPHYPRQTALHKRKEQPHAEDHEEERRTDEYEHEQDHEEHKKETNQDRAAVDHPEGFEITV